MVLQYPKWGRGKLGNSESNAPKAQSLGTVIDVSIRKNLANERTYALRLQAPLCMYAGIGNGLETLRLESPNRHTAAPV